jgi:hypothetical protein
MACTAAGAGSIHFYSMSNVVVDHSIRVNRERKEQRWPLAIFFLLCPFFAIDIKRSNIT